MRLSQIIAIDKSTKNQVNNDITAAYKELQKDGLFKGIARTYEPKDEDGERFPAESQKVQKRVSDLLAFTADKMSTYWDVTLTKDSANREAGADVIVDGEVIVKDAPVTFLLFLEKQLIDLATMIKTVPTLDPGENWHHDASSNSFATDHKMTVKTKKVPKAFVRVQATKEHPAQVDVFTEDVVVGEWKTTHFSGAIPQTRVTEILARITKLQAAVKIAREEANTISADDKHIGKNVFGYVLR